MNDDEVAQMMLEECLYNAGIIDKSPFHDEEEEKAFYKFYDKLKIGDVMLNQNSKMQPLDKNRNTYLIKLPPKDGNRNMADL